ncbi:MAG: MFS transporter, partial [Selenomonas sp.]|nr:MFS transporter [Selenomonas sp.]
MNAIKKRFRLYLIGNAISCIGTGMQFIANSWLALSLSGHNYAVALVLFFSALPGVLLSINTGKIVDKYDRKRLSTFIDIVRGLALVPVILCCVLDKLSAWNFYILSFILSLGEQIYTPSMLALLKEILPENKLLVANSRLAVGTQGGLLAGSIVGGICISLCGPVIILLINMG